MFDHRSKPTGKETICIFYCAECGWTSEEHPVDSMAMSCCPDCARVNRFKFVRFEPSEREQAFAIIRQDTEARKR